ncbi:hypothetical protein EDC04DRAFT_2741455 [Pisolithus marmoratus]|nr:hypothetical protein EDC04DRAFT_2741455 [Pisolithus marmoratus]
MLTCSWLLMRLPSLTARLTPTTRLRPLIHRHMTTVPLLVMMSFRLVCLQGLRNMATRSLLMSDLSEQSPVTEV